MANSWLIAQLSLEAPGFWLLLSMLALPTVYVLGRRVDPRMRPWLAAARWVLIPYAGLLFGGLSPRFLGLSKINWSVTLGLGVALLFGVLAVAAAVRISTLLETAAANDSAAMAGDRADDSDLPLERTQYRWSSVTLAALWMGAEQFHWCFVRGALWEMMLTWPYPNDGLSAYRTLWLATLIVLPEIWLQPSSLGRRFLKSTILVVTAVAFFYTRNFWLCWAIHVSLWLLIAGGSSSITHRSFWEQTDRSATQESSIMR